MRLLIDPPKRIANLAKHGLDLVDAEHFDWEAARYFDARYGREKAIGRLAGAIVVIIFKRLGTEAFGVISLRPANRKERGVHGTR